MVLEKDGEYQTERVRNEEVLRVKEEKNIQQTIEED
jgi:hypothetical protein